MSARDVSMYVAQKPAVLPSYDQAYDAYIAAPVHADGSGGEKELAMFYQVLDSLPDWNVSAILNARMDRYFPEQEPRRTVWQELCALQPLAIFAWTLLLVSLVMLAATSL